jgi:beta-lactamase superfamily II metal-dependent hydrolase
MASRRRLVSILLVAMAAACSGTDRPPAPEAERTLDLHFIDVEGGASTLIVTPMGESILVDSGMPGDRDPARIVRVAREVAGLERIDHHLITHWDIDHYGGTEQIGASIPIGRYYDHGPAAGPGDARYRKAYAAYLAIPSERRRVLKPDDTIPLRRPSSGTPLVLRIVASDGKVVGENPPSCDAHPAKTDSMNDNAASVAFVLTYGPFKFYNGGDLLWNLEHRLACPKNFVGTVDLFQVTHHGLPVSNNPALVHALRPRVAIMNNGDRKGCDPSVLKTLRECPGLEALFQMHLNLKIPEDLQAPPARIANRSPEAQCPGERITVRVAPDGGTYTVTVGVRGRPETFETR